MYESVLRMRVQKWARYNECASTRHVHVYTCMYYNIIIYQVDKTSREAGTGGSADRGC